MASLSFEIVTPHGQTFQSEVAQVQLPTPDGEVGILPHHIPLISVVSPGVISIKHHEGKTQGEFEHLATAGGFVEIDGRRVRLLADTAERAEDIDELKAKEALEEARQLLKNARTKVSLAEALSVIEQNMARLKVSELRRRHKKFA